MNDDDFRHASGSDRPAAGRNIDPAPTGGRREPVFGHFEEDEEYEESERDTDYASAYDDDDSDSYLEDDEPGARSGEWQLLEGTAEHSSLQRAGGTNPWETRDQTEQEDTTDEDDERYLDDEDEEHSEYEDNSDTGEPGDWEEEDYPDDTPELTEVEQRVAQSWPLGMIVVAVVALVLLAAGGYGVVQQRAAMQEEIRQLRVSLATAANPTEISAGREALLAFEERDARNTASIDALTLENRRLNDTVAGLEKQLTAQQTAVSRTATPQPAAAAPVPAKKAPAQPGVDNPAAINAASAPAGDGAWFVNFSSYGQRSAAEGWLTKLRPSAGKAVVAASTTDGRVLYRLRVVGLADRSQAETVARELQSEFDLPPLWVGKE
jgi:cell division septation protein DedD